MSLISKKLSLQGENETRLRDISCEIRPGELSVIIGPNGSGKTSLVKVLAGELSPSQGQVSLDNINLTDWQSEALARRRAVMPQHATLDFPFRVRDVVALGRSPYPRDVQKDTKLVATLQLKDRKYMVFKPVITVSDEKKKFEWLGTTQHGFMEMNKALKERAEFISNS